MTINSDQSFRIFMRDFEHIACCPHQDFVASTDRELAYGIGAKITIFHSTVEKSIRIALFIIITICSIGIVNLVFFIKRIVTNTSYFPLSENARDHTLEIMRRMRFFHQSRENLVQANIVMRDQNSLEISSYGNQNFSRIYHTNSLYSVCMLLEQKQEATVQLQKDEISHYLRRILGSQFSEITDLSMQINEENKSLDCSLRIAIGDQILVREKITDSIEASKDAIMAKLPDLLFSKLIMKAETFGNNLQGFIDFIDENKCYFNKAKKIGEQLCVLVEVDQRNLFCTVHALNPVERFRQGNDDSLAFQQALFKAIFLALEVKENKSKIEQNLATLIENQREILIEEYDEPRQSYRYVYDETKRSFTLRTYFGSICFCFTQDNFLASMDVDQESITECLDKIIDSQERAIGEQRAREEERRLEKLCQDREIEQELKKARARFLLLATTFQLEDQVEIEIRDRFESKVLVVSCGDKKSEYEFPRKDCIRKILHICMQEEQRIMSENKTIFDTAIIGNVKPEIIFANPVFFMTSCKIGVDRDAGILIHKGQWFLQKVSDSSNYLINSSLSVEFYKSLSETLVKASDLLMSLVPNGHEETVFIGDGYPVMHRSNGFDFLFIENSNKRVFYQRKFGLAKWSKVLMFTKTKEPPYCKDLKFHPSFIRDRLESHFESYAKVQEKNRNFAQFVKKIAFDEKTLPLFFSNGEVVVRYQDGCILPLSALQRVFEKRSVDRDSTISIKEDGSIQIQYSYPSHDAGVTLDEIYASLKKELFRQCETIKCAERIFEMDLEHADKKDVFLRHEVTDEVGYKKEITPDKIVFKILKDYGWRYLSPYDVMEFNEHGKVINISESNEEILEELEEILEQKIQYRKHLENLQQTSLENERFLQGINEYGYIGDKLRIVLRDRTIEIGVFGKPTLKIASGIVTVGPSLKEVNERLLLALDTIDIKKRIQTEVNDFAFVKIVEQLKEEGTAKKTFSKNRNESYSMRFDHTCIVNGKNPLVIACQLYHDGFEVKVLQGPNGLEFLDVSGKFQIKKFYAGMEVIKRATCSEIFNEKDIRFLFSKSREQLTIHIEERQIDLVIEKVRDGKFTITCCSLLVPLQTFKVSVSKRADGKILFHNYITNAPFEGRDFEELLYIMQIEMKKHMPRIIVDPFQGRQIVRATHLKRAIDLYCMEIVKEMTVSNFEVLFAGRTQDVGGPSREFISDMFKAFTKQLAVDKDDLHNSYVLSRYHDIGSQCLAFKEKQEQFFLFGKMSQIAYYRAMTTGKVLTSPFFSVMAHITQDDLDKSHHGPSDLLCAKRHIAQLLLDTKKEEEQEEFSHLLPIIEYLDDTRTLESLLQNKAFRIHFEVLVDSYGETLEIQDLEDIELFTLKIQTSKKMRHIFCEYLNHSIEISIGKYLHPILTIVKGMTSCSSLQNLTVRLDGRYENRRITLEVLQREHFSSNLQGSDDKETIINSIVPSGGVDWVHPRLAQKIGWIKQYLRECDQEETIRFLFFATGSQTLLSSGGIYATLDGRGAIIAHTCTNQISISTEAETKEAFIEKLKCAILTCNDGFAENMQ